MLRLYGIIRAMKQELLVFAAGYIAKAVIGATIGEAIAKPVAGFFLRELALFPRVIHYLEVHPTKRSYNCDQCRLGTPDKVDSISQS